MQLWLNYMHDSLVVITFLSAFRRHLNELFFFSPFLSPFLGLNNSFFYTLMLFCVFFISISCLNESFFLPIFFLFLYRHWKLFIRRISSGIQAASINHVLKMSPIHPLSFCRQSNRFFLYHSTFSMVSVYLHILSIN